MASEPIPRIIVPKPAIPRTMGTLNIIFASILLLSGLCSGITALMLPLMLSKMEPLKQARAESQVKHKADVAKLLEQEQAAQTQTEKDELKEKRLDLEDQADMEAIGVEPMAMFGTSDPVVMVFTAADVISGLLLNTTMLVAGIGLIWFQEWGRKLGLWVAGLKILRLLAVCLISIAVIVPITTKKSTDFTRKMEEMEARQAARRGKAPMPVFTAMNQPNMAKWTAITGVAGAVGLLVFGSIYPAITLWLLSTEECRAACQSATKPKPESPVPLQSS
jgi:hypothetical protein